MSMIQDTQEAEWTARFDSRSPFSEIASAASEDGTRALGFSAWTENLTPFADTEAGVLPESEFDRLLSEAFTELRDEAFDEAVSFLAEETEQVVAERFTGEAPSSMAERERFAETHLSGVRFEAEQYLQSLEEGLAGMDVESLTDQQLDEVLDRFAPQTGELSPAGEEFIGKLIKKAKGAVKFVAKAAKGVVGGVVKTVGKVASAVIGPVLKKLRGLINPLLKRVLSFAIGRLPAPLQPVARKLAARFVSESGDSEADMEFESAGPSSTNLTDIEALAESFDAALAEAVVGQVSGEADSESYEGYEAEASVEGRELENLALARGELIDRLRDASGEQDLAPHIEQFVPALLGALRIGINLIGRPKVVGFLAKYVGQLIRRFVGPQLSAPLSNAIVDTGLRLIMLEAESDEASAISGEAGSVALASVVEDTVRRLAENEDYVFDNEELMQLATAEAFSQAVASHFPPKFVRPALQQAPSLGGTFVARRPRSIRTYRKYSRTPEVEITAQIADALPTFGGTTLGAALRAAGVAFPVRARMHIYQSAVGTTLPRMVRLDRAGGSGRGYAATSNVHPLTPQAAGVLLREPQLGVAVPPAFLRSRNRIAVGQRFYLLEPMNAASALALPVATAGRQVAARLAPSRAWIRTDLSRGRIAVGFYLSEAETQRVVAAIRQGNGGNALLQSLNAAFRAMTGAGAAASARPRVLREDSEDSEELLPALRRRMPAQLKALLHRRLAGWVLPALANWVKTNSEAFVRAAAHPDAGVTIRVELSAVPGLGTIAQAAAAAVRGGGAAVLSALRGTPTIAISVAPGRQRR